MPPDVATALARATAAAGHLREQLAQLAGAVARDDTAAIITAARRLAARDEEPAPVQDSPERPEPEARAPEGDSS